MTTIDILIMTGLPASVVGGVVGLMFSRLKRQIEKSADEQRSRDNARIEYEVHQIKMQSATTALCKANAIALQNGRCNGETHAALAYLEEVKLEQRLFLEKHGIEHIYEKL